MKFRLLASIALFLLAATAVFAASRPTLCKYDILLAFPAGRLAALSAGDVPAEKGFTGRNRRHGAWVESGSQRGARRGVVAAVVACDLDTAVRVFGYMQKNPKAAK